MNQQQEIMVFAIGAGVGVAAVIGTLKVCVYMWALVWIVYVEGFVLCRCLLVWKTCFSKPAQTALDQNQSCLTRPVLLGSGSYVNWCEWSGRESGSRDWHTQGLWHGACSCVCGGSDWHTQGMWRGACKCVCVVSAS
jgi:hypothetical protein